MNQVIFIHWGNFSLARLPRKHSRDKCCAKCWPRTVRVTGMETLEENVFTDMTSPLTKLIAIPDGIHQQIAFVPKILCRIRKLDLPIPTTRRIQSKQTTLHSVNLSQKLETWVNLSKSLSSIDLRTQLQICTFHHFHSFSITWYLQEVTRYLRTFRSQLFIWKKSFEMISTNEGIRWHS